jgi:hypothetical protein
MEDAQDFTMRIEVPTEKKLSLFIRQERPAQVALMQEDGDDNWYLLSIKVNSAGKMYFSLATSVPDDLGFLLDEDGSIVAVTEGGEEPF